jgi:cytochrome c6
MRILLDQLICASFTACLLTSHLLFLTINTKSDHLEKKEILMKRIFAVLVMLLTIANLAFSPAALAADIDNGAKLFSSNCAACHMGGGNAIAAAMTLKKEALAANGKDTVEAIVAQITKGKNAMPAFETRLNPEQREDIAAYVLAQAAKDWK